VSRTPQAVQKAEATAFSAPQWGQPTGSRVPHCPQNNEPSELSLPQDEHLIDANSHPLIATAFLLDSDVPRQQKRNKPKQPFLPTRESSVTCGRCKFRRK
jgi:hypothetical protein